MNPSGKNILSFSVDVGVVTDPGKVRENNEDSFIALDRYGCFAVADGMGGAEAGEVASKMIVDAIEKQLPLEGSLPAAREHAVIQSAYRVNGKINNFCLAHNFDSMGTTLACMLVDSWEPHQATLFHAGDSRIYRFRDGEYVALTRDHTLAECGDVPEELLPKDQRGVLTNVLGISSDFYLERQYADIQTDDIFVICSDGLYRMVSDDVAARILAQSMTISSSMIAQLLVAEALSRGGHDNVTAIVVRFSRIGASYRPPEWELMENNFLQEQNIDDLSDTQATETSSASGIDNDGDGEN